MYTAMQICWAKSLDMSKVHCSLSELWNLLPEYMNYNNIKHLTFKLNGLVSLNELLNMVTDDKKSYISWKKKQLLEKLNLSCIL